MASTAMRIDSPPKTLYNSHNIQLGLTLTPRGFFSHDLKSQDSDSKIDWLQSSSSAIWPLADGEKESQVHCS